MAAAYCRRIFTYNWSRVQCLLGVVCVGTPIGYLQNMVWVAPLHPCVLLVFCLVCTRSLVYLLPQWVYPTLKRQPCSLGIFLDICVARKHARSGHSARPRWVTSCYQAWGWRLSRLLYLRIIHVWWWLCDCAPISCLFGGIVWEFGDYRTVVLFDLFVRLRMLCCCVSCLATTIVRSFLNRSFANITTSSVEARVGKP